MEKKQSSINAFFGKKRKRDDDELEYVAGSSHQVEAEPVPTADESKSDDQPSGSAAADVAINVPELHSIDIKTVAVTENKAAEVGLKISYFWLFS